MQGRVLIVGGSDSGGGAGIQADIKAVTALDGFAATAITALTAQNTLGGHGVEAVSPDFLEAPRAAVPRGNCAHVREPGLRGGAPDNSGEASTCKRDASGAQRGKMTKYRAWFQERRRPPRG